LNQSYLQCLSSTLGELLESADHALLHVIVLHPRKRTVYNLRKLTHGLTIPPVCWSLMRKNFLIRMLYTDVYWHVCLSILPLIYFYYRHLVHKVGQKWHSLCWTP